MPCPQAGGCSLACLVSPVSTTGIYAAAKA